MAAWPRATAPSLGGKWLVGERYGIHIVDAKGATVLTKDAHSQVTAIAVRALGLRRRIVYAAKPFPGAARSAIFVQDQAAEFKVLAGSPAEKHPRPGPLRYGSPALPAGSIWDLEYLDAENTMFSKKSTRMHQSSFDLVAADGSKIRITAHRSVPDSHVWVGAYDSTSWQLDDLGAKFFST